MELLIEEEIKTYSYYSKGQEGEGPPCLGRRLTRLSPSAKIKVRECQLGTSSRLLALPPDALLNLFYFDGREGGPVFEQPPYALALLLVRREWSSCRLPRRLQAPSQFVSSTLALFRSDPHLPRISPLTKIRPVAWPSPLEHVPHSVPRTP